MHSLNDAIAEVFSDHDILPSDVPQLDLYMDQILSLFEQGLRDSKRDPSDKLLTKTMVNNYVKEGLVNPVRGKKIYPAADHAAIVHLPSQANASSQ